MSSVASWQANVIPASQVNTAINGGNAEENLIAEIVDHNGVRLLAWHKDGAVSILGLPTPEASTLTALNRETLAASAFKITDTNGVGLLAGTVNGDTWVAGLSRPLNHLPFLARSAALSRQLSGAFGSAKTKSIVAVDSDGQLHTFGVEVQGLTSNSSFNTNAWVQGKLCEDEGGRLYLGYNQGSDHIASDLRPVVVYSDDNGKTWSNPVTIALPAEGASNGAWSASLGSDQNGNMFCIVRQRGADFLVANTFHQLYKSTDRGATWTLVGTLPGPTQSGYTPVLYHDMELVDGKMVAGFHFEFSARMGLIFFDPTDPLNTVTSVDLRASGSGPIGLYVEPTCHWVGASNKIIGGMRVQPSFVAGATTSPTPPLMYICDNDGSNYTSFNAPDSVPYNPYPVVVWGTYAVTVSCERYVKGELVLWLSDLTGFLAGTPDWWSVRLGRIIDEQIAQNSTETGVCHLHVSGTTLHIGFGHNLNEGRANIYHMRIDTDRAANILTYNYLESINVVA